MTTSHPDHSKLRADVEEILIENGYMRGGVSTANLADRILAAITPYLVAPETARLTNEEEGDLRAAIQIVRNSAKGANFADTYCLGNRIGFLLDRLLNRPSPAFLPAPATPAKGEADETESVKASLAAVDESRKRMDALPYGGVERLRLEVSALHKILDGAHKYIESLETKLAEVTPAPVNAAVQAGEAVSPETVKMIRGHLEPHQQEIAARDCIQLCDSHELLRARLASANEQLAGARRDGERKSGMFISHGIYEQIYNLVCQAVVFYEASPIIKDDPDNMKAIRVLSDCAKRVQEMMPQPITTPPAALNTAMRDAGKESGT